MSVQKGIIEISVPEYDLHNETYYFGGYKCTRCGGNGGRNEQIGRDDWKWHECNHCQGSGKVKAVVEVKWSPDLD